MRKGGIISSLFCINFCDYSNNQQLYSCTLCISKDRNVYSFGSSIYGTHGHKDELIFPPKQIKGLNDIKMIYCGGNHTCCLDFNGNVFSFGSNSKGQLGIGKSKDELKFTYIPQKINLPSCKQISCGAGFTLCLTEENKLYSFGSNDFGQLGLGVKDSFNYPQQILLDDIEFIESGAYHSICKTHNNHFYSWGDNEHGTLGNGNNDDCNKPIKCINWPDNIIDIKSGWFHSLLLTSEGQVYSFGDNRGGQLGINDKYIKSINIPTLIKDIPEIQRIECGYYHCFFIDMNNNLWTFGFNGKGKLGLGDKEKRYKPIKNTFIKDIIDISSGGDNIFVKTSDNKIFATGPNHNLQLGVKTEINENVEPIQTLEGIEDIWDSFIGKSKQKSARK